MSSKKLSRGGLRTMGGSLLRFIPALVMLLLILVAGLNTFSAAIGSVPVWVERVLDWLSGFSSLFLATFLRAAPFLLIGGLASGLLEEFVSRKELAGWLPRALWLGALTGGFLGLFIPVGEGGGVPFARRLMRKGAPAEVGIAALLAVPALNPVVIALTLSVFGVGPLFWARLGLSLAVAVLTGLAFSFASDPAEVLRLGPESEPVREAASTPALAARMRRAMVAAVDEFFEMSGYLIAGALIAGLLQMVIPQGSLLGAGRGPISAALLMMGLAVLLSPGPLAGTLAALAYAGSVPGGAILAFLVFGAVVNFQSAAMYLGVFKPRAVLYLVLLPLMLTLVAAFLINTVWPGWMI